MRFSIDVVFLDCDGRELSRRPAVRPGRVVLERRAASVLELAPGPEPRAIGQRLRWWQGIRRSGSPE